MIPILRAIRRALLRPHIENGLSVAVGVALCGLAAGWWLGLLAGITAATGALCVSIADQPDPLNEKPRAILAAAVLACAGTFLALIAKQAQWSLAAATILTGFWTGLISAYGTRAIGLGVVTILAFVMAMGTADGTQAAMLIHLGLFAAGCAGYAMFALGSAWLFDRRVRRLLLAEAMRSFAQYLRAKARLLNLDEPEAAAFSALIEAHAATVERMQAARDAIYARNRTAWQKRQAGALIALMDSFETILSSDADIAILRGSQHRHLLRRLQSLTALLAHDIDRLILSLDDRDVPADRHQTARTAIAGEVARIARAAQGDEAALREAAALRSTADKIGHAAERIAAIADALQSGNEIARAGQDLSAFRQAVSYAPSILRAQFRLEAPALRYAIRLSLALTTGLVLTFVLPDFAHASWILLTTALIMRANYSVTRQRRFDRIVGTLIGCVLATGLIVLVPAGYLLAVVALSVGVSHAYGAISYRVTAISASISSLLLLHFLDPVAHHILLERIGDTLIGAALSYAFGFLLPNWERNDLPRIVAGLLKADADFAAQALQRGAVEMDYRLARKRLFDTVAALSGAVRRVADEPHAGRTLLAKLNDLLGANYLLLSELTSMRVLFQMRGGELEPVLTDTLVGEMRERVLAVLQPRAFNDKVPPRLSRTSRTDLYAPNSLSVLKRRLVHIEHAARRVARLARETAP